MDLKEIGDTLSLGEFNAYVSMLRGHISLSENINISGTSVKGQYATYVFNFNNSTIVDKGLLMTPETKNAENTVVLEAPVFSHSNYYLKFQLMSISDYNLFVEDSSSYIQNEDLEIVLNATDNSVELDLSDYDEDFVLLLDIQVRIIHEIPNIAESSD